MSHEAQRCCYIACGRLYIPGKNNANRASVYCSLACSGAAKRKRLLRRECPSCEREFFHAHNAKPTYCSTACRDVGMTTDAGKVLVRCVRGCGGLFHGPHECQPTETYGYSMLALADGWS